MSLPSSAEIVIVGGGAVGLGVAYALAQAGKTDIVLLEREPNVGAVTTSQGAGLCGQVRDSAERIRLAIHSVRVFRHLQATDVQPDWHEVGSLRVAFSEKRAAEFDRLKAAADAAGLEVHLLDATDARRLWPLMDFAAARSILWCPTDGWMTPTAVARSYAAACQRLGTRIVTATGVESVVLRNGRVDRVTTTAGASVECRYLINAAGAHAHHIARLAGLDLPIVPVRHEYFITVELPGLDPSLPCFRIPEWTLYGRVRDGGLLLGGWEPKSLHTDPRSYPIDGAPPAVQPDWPVLQSFEDSFRALMPSCAGAAKRVVGRGWPTFTPDGRFIIGESARVPGFVMAGGCNAHGISGSGGIGRLLLESLLDPKPSDYVRSLSPDRFTETAWSWDNARIDAARIYETYYGVDG